MGKKIKSKDRIGITNDDGGLSVCYEVLSGQGIYCGNIG